MFKKKICLLGEFGVGKTSLIRQYVLHAYSDKYISTVGVVINKKTVLLPNGIEVMLLIWDMEGQEDFSAYSKTYLRGLSGYILVADGTRPETLATASATKDAMTDIFPAVPSVLLLNKHDLQSDWKIKKDDCSDFSDSGIRILNTSAKTGAGVDSAFMYIAEKMAGTEND
ncbi:MAG: Rab family GTPase [Spirochaetia bacterium]|jgi:small GTP-binding protein|nr:Rab family GTPase [Spirochaetia bacterium]